MLQDLFAAHHRHQARVAKPGVVLAGGAGHLGAALVEQLTSAFGGSLGEVELLVTDVHHATPDGLRDRRVPDTRPESWPPMALESKAAVIAFEPRREFYRRETAIWVPDPKAIAALCQWLHTGGVRHVVLVMPHAYGQLPQGMKNALANLDEQAVAAIGFEHVILLRSAQAPKAARDQHPLERLAQSMLSIVRYMIPERERPVRAQHVAEFAVECLAWAVANPRPAVKVASPEAVWQIATAPNSEALRERAREWLG